MMTRYCEHTISMQHFYQDGVCAYCREEYTEAPIIQNNQLIMDKETALELLEVLDHQYIDYDNSLVHELIKKMWVFVGEK